MKAFTKRPKVRRVRCLGPGPEHTFLSTDPARNRICPACARKLAYEPSNLRVRDRQYKPLPFHED